jgi:TetR/AcrR family transcriptional regulator, fatty acid biosynthesis regulator
VAHLHDDTPHFMFITRERYGGDRRLRRVINLELQLFADELALDLVALQGVGEWSVEERRMLAGLITETIIHMVAELLESGPESESVVVERTMRQLQLISLGVPTWESERGTRTL